jgi:general stress protein YciG
MTDKRRSAMAGDRPGTRTAEEDYQRAAQEAKRRGCEHVHGQLSKDPRGVFKAHHKSRRKGERDFSEDPKRRTK